MPSKTYRLIWRAMRAREQLVFDYDGKPREACPVILGYDEHGAETAFVYQFAGATSAGSVLPQWRCFKLAGMREPVARPGPWVEGTSHQQAQTCVRHVDVDVNIADTLARGAPQPLGSSGLRRPRGR